MLGLTSPARPQLSLSGQNAPPQRQCPCRGVLPLTLVVANKGTAPAHGIKLSSDEPSDWKVAFEPAQIDELAPGKTQEVKAMLTPSSRRSPVTSSMVTLTASGDGTRKSSDFRVTVETSTIWGIVGVVVIAASVVVLSLAVMRFGRR
ncbi:MAG: NEW3 domain-containing protein [Dongiaceae bacterium]